MSHKPPVPEAATPPWPATPPPPIDHPGAPAAKEPPRGTRVDPRIVAGVAGIAVGSAAIAAALLFTSRHGKARPAATPKPGGPPGADRRDVLD